MKKRIKVIGLVFLLLNLSFVGLSYFSSLTSQNDNAMSALNQVEQDPEKGPISLESSVYDCYANGEIVDRGSSKDPLMRPTASSHPITKDEFQFVNLEEFAVLPFEYTSANPRIYQDAGESFAGNHTFSDPIWPIDSYHGYRADIAFGDIDADGYDEVIIAPYASGITIYDDANNSYAKLGDFAINGSIGGFRSLAIGDVNGNGFDDIVLISWIQTGPAVDDQAPVDVVLWVHEYVPTWNSLTSTDFVVNSNYITTRDVFFGYNPIFAAEPEVACGDFDGDGYDEIACAFSYRNQAGSYEDFWLLDDYFNSFVEIMGDRVQTGMTGDIDLTMGDFDGDGLDEIAYATCPFMGGPNRLYYQLFIIDSDLSVIDLPITSVGSEHTFRSPTACGDIDGDGRDEIASVLCLESANPGGMNIYEFTPADEQYVKKGVTQWRPYMDYGFSMGDVDCDGLAEMVFSGRFGNGVLDDANHSYTELFKNPSAYGGIVVCGDPDGDGMRLRYTGESWVTTAPPGVIVVVAAPPLYQGIDQNYISSYTAFGEETSIGSGESSEIGTSVGTTYSVEQEIGVACIEALRITWSRTLSTEFTRTNTVTKTLVKTMSYATGWTDDAVVYHMTDYTSYKYQIIHHPYNSSIVGSDYTINVPASPGIYTWTLDFFNEHYNDLIGSETFNHTPGRPWTYLSRSEALAQIPLNWSSGEQIVGQGSGFMTCTIEVAEQTVTGMKSSEYSDYSTGGAIFGVGLDHTNSMFSSKSYEISVGEAAIYEGCVGFIADQETWTELGYTYNMLVYYLDHPVGITYQVINYYVEGAVPHGRAAIFFQDNWQVISGVGGGVLGGVAIITGAVLIPRRLKARTPASAKKKTATTKKKPASAKKKTSTTKKKTTSSKKTTKSTKSKKK